MGSIIARHARVLSILAGAAALGLGCGRHQGPPPAAACAALVTASRNGDVAAITNLLASGDLDPNTCVAGVNGWTPIFHAIHKNQPDAVEALIRGGASVNRGSPSFTPLMMAVGNGQLRTTRLLLDAGADPRAVNGDGASVFSIAVSGGALTDIENPLLGACHTEIVRELLKRAPDLRLEQNLHGRFARWAAWLNGCDEVITVIASR